MYDDDGVWQLALRTSGLLTKIYVIPYVITVKNRFGTKAHYPPQFETVTYDSQLKKTKIKPKKQKNLSLSIFAYCSLLSLSIFMFGKSPSPMQNEGKKN